MADSSFTLIQQGAEARVYRGLFLGREAIKKERFPKAYRHPILDEKLTGRRVKEEAKTMARAYKCGLDVPVVYHVDTENHTIIMEYVHGKMVKVVVEEPASTPESRRVLSEKMGRVLATLHRANIVHGDLTTSNMLLHRGSKEEEESADGDSLVLIDFGLSYTSTMVEDKAVDLYVLERALGSTHPKVADEMFRVVLEAYRREDSSQGAAVLKRLEQVRARGRKRDMVG